MTAKHGFISALGVRLHVESEGAGHPVVLLHGFTGTTRSLAPIARGLRDAWRAIRIDLVGHGSSDAPRDVAHYSMERCVAQVVCVLDALGATRPHLLGYSMGGRVALALCAAHPERFTSALLIGASAGIEDAAERAARVRADESLASRIERNGVASFVERWMAQPLFASMQRLGAEAQAASRADRLRNSATGLANSLRGMGSGAQPALHARLPGLRVPVRLVAGALDPKFRRIAAELAERLPDARVEIVADAGHAVPAECPEALVELAQRFFREVERGGQGARREVEGDRERVCASRPSRPRSSPDGDSASPNANPPARPAQTSRTPTP